MSLPPLARVLRALDATWPPAALHRAGPWLLREGAGGGKRVSAASLEPERTATWDHAPNAIPEAEAAMRRLGQRPLFRLSPLPGGDEAALDSALAARGYRPIDPTAVLVAPVGLLNPGPQPVMQAFALWPPLAVQRALWADAGVGPRRQAIMARVAGSCTTLMGRQSDRVAGTAFVACDGDVAMLHALEVTPALRRQGAARNIMHAAAAWAQAQGAAWLALAVTRANAPALALYAGLGMTEVGGYAYRQHPGGTPGALPGGRGPASSE